MSRISFSAEDRSRKAIEKYCEKFMTTARQWKRWLTRDTDEETAMSPSAASPIGSMVTQDDPVKQREAGMYVRLTEAMIDGLPADFKAEVSQEFQSQIATRKTFGERQLTGKEMMNNAATSIVKVMTQDNTGAEGFSSTQLTQFIQDALRADRETAGKKMAHSRRHQVANVAPFVDDWDQQEGINVMGNLPHCVFYSGKTKRTCGEGSVKHNPSSCWQSDNLKSRVPYTLRAFKELPNFVKICRLLCTMSSASEAFEKMVGRGGAQDAVSIAEIRKEIAGSSGLMVKADDETRKMIDDQGVTVPCQCGLFDGDPQQQKEAWRKCFIPQMFYTLMRKETPDKTTCASVEDFCHDCYEMSEIHKEAMA